MQCPAFQEYREPVPAYKQPRREERRGRTQFQDRNEYRQQQPPHNNFHQQAQPAQQAPPKPRDPVVDDLANEFAKLRASVANLAAKFDPNAEPQQYGNPTTTPHRTNQVNQQPRDLSNQRCYKCHEPGHFAAQCQSEACRIPENQGYPTECCQAHVANYFEDSDGEEEPDFWPEVVEAMTNPMEAYPAICRNEVSPT